MKNLNRARGVSLVAAVAIMLIIAVLTSVMAGLVGTTSRGAIDYLRSAQALVLAQAGLNWYMMRLRGIADWSGEADQADVPLGPGTFDITLSNKTSTRLDFTVTGKVSGTNGVTIRRTMSQRAWKLPSASKFALFWGRRTGSNLALNSTTINGNYWSQGTSSIPAGSTVTAGIAYRPATEDITGAGAYTEKSIAFPYFSDFSGATSTFSTPAINTAYYTNLISTYNGIINACSSVATVNQNTNLALSGNTVCCRNFNTNTTAGSSVTISGNGVIVAEWDIALNTAGGSGRTLSISPSGGNILILAGRSLTVNAAGGTNAITGSSGIEMYSRSASANTQLLTVNNNATNIDGALIFANRRIIVRNSANLTNCKLFVNYPGDNTNNYLEVDGAGTSVGTAADPCSLISIGRSNAGGAAATALTIDNSASTAGFCYQYDTANTGLARINSATITGSLIANQFQGNAINSATITYNPSAIPDPPPEGFNDFATKKPDSWSGN